VERAGVPTIAVGTLKGAMLRVRYPRGLVTPFTRGETMGPPGDRATQQRVLTTALSLLATATSGTVVSFE
jgi:hypothetical protein